jgi:hypothetical protein
VHVEDRGRIRVGLERSQYVDYTRRTVERDRRRVACFVVPDAPECTDVDTVVGVLVRDDDRVDLAGRHVTQ